MTDRLTTQRSALQACATTLYRARRAMAVNVSDLHAAIREAKTGGMSVIELARLSGLSRVTVYKILKEEK